MKSKNLLFLLFASALSAQSFNYQRDWGTYYGATHTNIIHLYEDSSNNLIVDGATYLPVGITPTPNFYNQFVSSGGNLFTMGPYPFMNNFPGKFSPSGNLIFAEYQPSTNSYSSEKTPYYRDQSGNRYEYERSIDSSLYPVFSYGTWLSNNITNNDTALAKYDSDGNLLWKTFIPGSNLVNIKTDDSGNIYLSSATTWQNISDVGTYYPNFTTIYPTGGGDPLPNPYIVKLNPNGQKIWATYIPAESINALEVYNNKIYIVAVNDVVASNSMATPGTFQQEKSNQSIISLNADNGQRRWGTYYGEIGNTGSLITDIRANSTGIYVVGDTFHIGDYYASEGAHKTETTDGFDLYLSKFNDLGQREWSTYIGSDGYEIGISSNALDIKDDKILVTGTSQGIHNMASPGAYISTKPNSDINLPDPFFTMFNSSGEHIFTSYYGSPFINYTQNLAISPYFSKDSETFYLFGKTENPTGYSSPNGNQQNIISLPGNNNNISGFIAKFSLKFLSASEANSSEDLVLYNNPNNGNFSLKGSVLNKESHIITINDLSGRLIYSKNINKNKVEYFNLENQLSNGNYILSVKKSDKTVIKSFKLIIKK